MTNVDQSARTVSRPDGTVVGYSTVGPAQGPTWVYVHGWGCRRTDFDPVAALLPEGDRIVSVDLPGHGDSTSDRTAWTMAEFARDVAAVLDAESVQQCVVVGHSLGGAVALELARLRPEVVTQVIGLDSFHYLGLYPAVEDAAARGLLQTFEDDFPTGVRSLVVMGSVPDTDPAFAETIFTKASRLVPAVGIGTLAEMLRWDMDEALAAVPHPVATLAVRGLLDPAAPQRYGDRIEFVVHDLGSHHFLLERPDETAALLLTTRTTA
ncbi:MAG: alpha/beta hydrolase [Pseudonocardia sp.]|uniref:alpha/beta fold hydrolase n=1 Tax=unclassified Pseudonocardia TaxID=2619320 RepID=UPI0008694C3D|nr:MULTISPECIES: alpha/beta hydrolase [unclassified Pseudonocardia]MBN9110829.1 alpha/beta hydrolase [Pseudonocardia sp.]ODU26867.1 MAG: hydrolase [Pseudonocardia sp. SCN 72-51]ODV05412.1 MAG: hydrolase [Pseudonocardia sp. SCN 73-27]